MEPTDAHGDTIDLLIFRLGPERYGVETRYVANVVGRDGLRPVDGGPWYLVGEMPLAGERVEVASAREIFGVEERNDLLESERDEEGAATGEQIVVFNDLSGGHATAWLVDVVETVLSVATEEIRHVDDSMTNIRGLVPGDEPVVWVNAEQVLSDR